MQEFIIEGGGQECLPLLSTPLLPCQLLAYFFFFLIPSKVEILVMWLVSVWENWAEVLQAKSRSHAQFPSPTSQCTPWAD